MEPRISAFLVGCVGALIPEILHWHRIARRGRWPQYGSSVRYWVITVILILLGGAVTALVSPPGSSAMQLLLPRDCRPEHSAIWRLKNQRLASKDGQPHLGANRFWLRDFLAL